MNQPQDPRKPKLQIWLPLLFALVMALGMYIGNKMQTVSTPGNRIVLRNSGGKLDQVLRLIQNRYVDSLDADELSDKALNELLQQLDPYSSFISAKQYEAVNQPLEGNFEGIGIEFFKLNDTILVVSAISGGPSEQVGLRAGDKIITVEDENVAGQNLSNDDIISKLRGKKGSKVRVGIKRNGQADLLQFTITRDKIPIYSVDVAYMLAPGIGYIKINKFSATTAEEFRRAFLQLHSLQPLQALVLDLRGNPGGYLDAAIKIADEFLTDGQLITYTEGRAQPRRDFKASRRGMFEAGNLVVLIDEGSASASEIVSGAVQDWDRGTIIGRRSFGKGLVQEQFDMRDGSAIRLTVSRYYTPSGRSIQKPYEQGKNDDDDFTSRVLRGELFSADSIRLADSTLFKTALGRPVFGGGGIMPDIFVPADSNKFSAYLNALLNNGTIIQFCYQYADDQRHEKEAFANATQFVDRFTVTDKVIAAMQAFAKTEGITPEKNDKWQADLDMIRLYLKANIGRQWFGNDAFFPVMHGRDKVVKRAVEEARKKLEVGG
ncbi:MAG: S41 family peptidase [Bacteroidia bacterium]